MKILFCNFEYPPLGGGGGVVNAQVAQELARRHEVTVLTSQGLSLPRQSVENGVKIHRVPVFFRRQEATANLHSMLVFIPMAIAEGRKLLQSNRYDVINTHFVLPTGPVGDYLARAAGIPNILTVHGGDLFDPSKFTSPHRHPFLRTWIRSLLRRADGVVGQSHNTLTNMRRFYTPEIEGIRIPLGIYRPCASNALRENYGFSKDDVLLITVGRLIPRKAVHQLIKMVNDLKDQRVHLLVLGSGPEERSLKDQAQALHVADHIHFMGFVDEVEKFNLLGISDIYVSTSQHEGFCLAFLEAMASSLPVICYDQGGQTDYLTDGETGFVVPLNDIAQFTDRCKKLVRDGILRKQIGEKNKVIVEEYYIDNCASRYEVEFKKAVELKQRDRKVGLFQSSRPSMD